MAKERILITVKTYPTLSRKHGELVCTAGIRADGSWVRIYPVPFRLLNEAQQYSKYDWVECELVRRADDRRPETYRPANPQEMKAVGHVDTADDWRERRRLLLGPGQVFTNLDALIADAHTNRRSLATFRPTKILDFVCEPDDPEWRPELVAEMRAKSQQGQLFDDDKWRETFRLIPKLPWAFSYRFEDDVGRQSELEVQDWEVGALYANCLRNAAGDQQRALAKVREMYFDTFLKKDLHFYLGTTLRWHSVGPNPWIIIGVLPIPHERQPSLF